MQTQAVLRKRGQVTIKEEVVKTLGAEPGDILELDVTIAKKRGEKVGGASL
jgi:bifunctional DNA-binding transcriptional regulator/antitoxin component of YhaV-PrlF toxin-antitoxin module